MNSVETVTFARRLRNRASQYFGDFTQNDEVNVRLVNKQIRAASVLYQFDLSTGDIRRSVMVKVPTERNEPIKDQEGGLNQANDRRPQLAPVPNPAKKFQLEYAALKEIRDYFNDLSDARFGAVHILDLFSDQQAIVMEEIQSSSLRQLFMETRRLRPSLTAINLDMPFRNAGAWLQAYHALPNCTSAKIRHSQRTEFIATIRDLTDFLTRTCGDEQLFQCVKAKCISTAHRELPESLPLGVRHGDFAPRNILISLDNRVTVIDTLAKWCMPIYSDIAYFLVALKTIRVQVFSQGLAFSSKYINRCEQEFLKGYFGDRSIPYKAIRLYEIQALLDKWSAVVTRLSPDSPPGSNISLRALQLVLLNRFFRESTNRLLRQID